MLSACAGGLDASTPFQPLSETQAQLPLPPAAITAARKGGAVWLAQVTGRSVGGQLGQPDAALVACAGVCEGGLSWQGEVGS